MSAVSDKIKTFIQDGTRDIKKAATDLGTDIHSPLPADLVSEVTKATNILHLFTDSGKNEGALDQVIPKDVFNKALGLAIFTVIKAGFFWSGRVGSGLVVAKLDDGTWSPPSCINIGGVGFGPQIGADVTDFIIILNTKEAVKAFCHGENLTLGGSLSVTAGPVAIGGEVSGSVYEAAALYSYSKSKGLFAGVSLEGTIIIERKDANKLFYGNPVSAEDILSGKVERPQGSIDSLYEAIKAAEHREQKE
ncbi:15814_t:CDS:2 [Acaulospora morrowiae]|uniref:15814_t:CDS:1 n=1 Tax=Acaulospora morrowiae TaxID=94023 RepID=A0A9N9AIL4_9GLOM|nr:15814_t:CDS:2 [Acaulospora morrowiae]